MKKLLICLLSLLLLTACGAKGEKAELLFFYDGAMYCSDGGPSPIEIVPEAIIGTVGSVVGSDEEPTENFQANFGTEGAEVALCGIKQDELYVSVENEWVRFFPREA